MPRRKKATIEQDQTSPVTRVRSSRAATKKAQDIIDPLLADTSIEEQLDTTPVASPIPQSADEESPDKSPPPAKKSVQKRKNTSRAQTTSKRARTSEMSSEVLFAGLFEAVKGGKTALRSLINQWIDEYKSDPTKAMLDVIQFIVDSSGCKSKITTEMFEQMKYSEIISQLTKNFAEESGDYPLIISTTAYKRFKSNFVEFVEKLIELCQNNIIYDGYFLDTLTIWLIGFTDSQVRAFRHTSTLACCKIVSSLIKIANTVRNDLDIAQRQLDAEKNKTSRSQAAAKLELLQTKLAELQEHMTDLEGKMSEVFTGVFVHRYRDSYHEIRALCIGELGVWMNSYSHFFLADNYTKYIGWMLYDKSSEVRLQALLALNTLYSCEEYPTHLDLFTHRFKERIVSMKLDVESSVAVQAINLCSILLQLDLLDGEEANDICELVFMENRAISHAAGQFLCQHLLSDEFLEKAKTMQINPGERRPPESHIVLKELLRFFTEVKVHEHAPYFVDALWDYTPILKDWQAMTQLLMDEPSSSLLTLGDEEETALVEMMCCAIQRSVGTLNPPGRGKARTGPRDKKHLQSVKEELSLHFMTELPALLVKYGTDVSKVANLVTIPQHFDYYIYVEHRLQKQLEDLMQALRDIMMRHSDQEVLNNCGITLKCLLDAELPQKMSLEVIKNEMVDEVVASLKQSLQSGILKEIEERDNDDEDLFALTVTLRRLKALFISFNLSTVGLSAELWPIVKQLQEGDQFDEIICTSLSCLMFNALWLMHTIDADDPDKSQMRAIKTESCELIDNCHELLQLGTRDVQKEAYITLCDTLIVFSRRIRTTTPLLAPLAYIPNDTFQRHVRDYVTSHVFSEMEQLEQEMSVDEEEQNEEKALALAKAINDRRVALAGYLKLVVFNVFDVPLAAPVFAHYVKPWKHSQHSDNFGDIIKFTLSKFREASPNHWYQPILLALQQEFERVRDLNSGIIDHTSAEWADTKDLARRFGLMFGFDAAKSRQPLVGLHREGIAYSLEGLDKASGDPPYNLDFLEILAELSSRLIEVDRSGNKGLLVYLREQLPEELTDEWEPLVIYQSSLAGRKGDDSNTDKRRAASRQTGGRGKGAGRRRKQQNQDQNTTKRGRKRKQVHQESEDDQSDRESEKSDIEEDQDQPPEDTNQEPPREEQSWMSSRPKRRKKGSSAVVTTAES